jgi:hypothetical protein
MDAADLSGAESDGEETSGPRAHWPSSNYAEFGFTTVWQYLHNATYIIYDAEGTLADYVKDHPSTDPSLGGLRATDIFHEPLATHWNTTAPSCNQPRKWVSIVYVENGRFRVTRLRQGCSQN